VSGTSRKPGSNCEVAVTIGKADYDSTGTPHLPLSQLQLFSPNMELLSKYK